MNPGYFLTALTVIGAGTFFLWLGSGDGIRSEAGPGSPSEKASRVRVSGHGGSTRHVRDSRRESFRTGPAALDGSPRVRIQPKQAEAMEKQSEVPRGGMHRPAVQPYLPLAFAEIPDEMRDDDRCGADLAAVQERFIAAIGGEAADPSTPEYRAKWMNAQRQADLELRARIGAQAFAARQRAARQLDAGAGREQP